MPLSVEESAIVAAADRLGPGLEERLRTLVGINSFTGNKEGVDRVGAICGEGLERLGFRVSELVTGTTGRTLVARRAGDPGHALLLVGHLDTVHPPESSFRELVHGAAGSDLATGPGAADMKGGLVVILGALEALAAAGRIDGRRLTVILNADEETGSAASAEIIRGEAADAHLGLCFEAGRPAPDGATTFVTARKGFGRFRVLARGREAHAGVDPGGGASAILELAHHIVALHACADAAAGTSVNVGVVRGGTTANTVPGEAIAEVDYRFPDVDAGAELEEALLEEVRRGRLHDAAGRPLVACSADGHVRRPALERSEAMGRMAARIVAWGADLGLRLVEESRGGSSDAAWIADAGCPAICGLGAVGGAFHTDQEWVRISSLRERARLAALTIDRFYGL